MPRTTCSSWAIAGAGRARRGRGARAGREAGLGRRGRRPAVRKERGGGTAGPRAVRRDEERPKQRAEPRDAPPPRGRIPETCLPPLAHGPQAPETGAVGRSIPGAAERASPCRGRRTRRSGRGPVLHARAQRLPRRGAVRRRRPRLGEIAPAVSPAAGGRRHTGETSPGNASHRRRTERPGRVRGSLRPPPRASAGLGPVQRRPVNFSENLISRARSEAPARNASVPVFPSM